MIPPQAACVDCGERVNPNASNTLREVIGWSKHRDAGGQNHVQFREETGRLLCGMCATRRRYGGNVHQGALL